MGLKYYLLCITDNLDLGPRGLTRKIMGCIHMSFVWVSKVQVESFIFLCCGR